MEKIGKERTAVLALHWLRDIASDEGALGATYGPELRKNDVVAKVQHLLGQARAHAIPVVYMRVCFQPGYRDLVVNAPLYGLASELNALIEGTPGTEIIPELAPQDSDIVLSNNRVSGFANSGLEMVLRTRRIDTLLFTGVATNLTVESTARQASDLGYRSIVVSDCVSADAVETHEASLRSLSFLAEVATAEEVIGAIG